MSHKILALLAFFLITLSSKSQPIGSSRSKTTISGLTLCQITTNDLQNLSDDFKEVELEEMDLPKNCYGQDSRFEAGKGIYSEKYRGVIFQKEQGSEKISKIRLTTDYVGNLPDGKPINLKGLLLKDLFIMYPFLEDAWGSRGCSNYWKFSNDTLAFYVKIDSNIKPQFPINKQYYLDKPIEAVDLIVSCENTLSEDSHIASLIPTDPIYFVDSVRVVKEELLKYDPSQIATLTVYKEVAATKILGNEGANGLIYIETIPFAKKRYWKFFTSRSKEYLEIVPHPGKDEHVIYILNGKVLQENFEGDLASIDCMNFVNLQIINKKELRRDFKVSNMTWGVVIKIKPRVKTSG